ncbi:MAG: hypothetical protein AAF960_22330 [Bacteroidota bacterium]
MKNLPLFIVALFVLFTACGEDDSTEISLRYDGPNQTAPLLQGDTYEAAARFPATITRDYIGQRLTQVSYYMTGIPLQTSLKIYSGGTEDMPGQVVYEASLTGSITQNSFNEHTLSTPLGITGEDLWISIRFRQNRTLQTIGCDPGPTVTNGDWLFRESDGRWLPFSQRTPESINWNIRGIVEL